MLTIIKNKRGQEVGFIDEKNRYRTTRDFDKGQIFRNPKYQSGVALDTKIIKELIRRGVTKIMIEIKNFEDAPFYIETDVKTLLTKGNIINFDKKSDSLGISTAYREQRVMPMQLWNRLYLNQRKIIEF